VKHAHRFTMIRHDLPLDDENFPRPRHGGAAVSQNRQRSIVVPVMDYLSQNVGVSPLRQRIKKAAPDNFASVSYCKIFENLTGACHNIRQIDQYTPHGRVSSQNRSEQKPVTTSNINNVSKTGEVVPLDDSGA
jgi:hypothetical protein